MQNEKEKTPILRGKHIGAEIMGIALKILGYIALVAFLSLVLSALTSSGSLIARIVNVVLLVGFFLLIFAEGGTRGEKDVTYSTMISKKIAEGREPERTEWARCYTPRKAWLGMAVGAGIFFICAVLVAVMAKPYTYELQDLPGWLGSYSSREDLTRALSGYNTARGATMFDYLRVVVRVCILPFVNLFSDVQASSLMIDRLSPLFILALPIGFPIGYLTGPRLHVKRLRENEKAKAAKVKEVKRKKKKEQRKRMQLEEKPAPKSKENRLI